MAGPRPRPGDRIRNMDPQRREEMRKRMMERRGGDKSGKDGPPPISEEMINWSLDAMKDKLPRLHDRLVALRASDPKRFEQAFRKLLPIFHEYRDLKERRPDIAEKVMEEFPAEDRLRELSKEYLTSKDDAAKQTALSQEMEQLVRKQFDLRRQRMEARLSDFEERIKEQQAHLQTMRDWMQFMSTKQNDFVSRRVSPVKAGRMGEPVQGMEPPPFGPMGRGPGRPGGPGPGGPGMDRPPPPPGDGPDDDRPPPPEGGGPPPGD